MRFCSLVWKKKGRECKGYDDPESKNDEYIYLLELEIIFVSMIKIFINFNYLFNILIEFVHFFPPAQLLLESICRFIHIFDWMCT